MKNKLSTFISFLIMVFLIAGIVFLAWAIYTDLLNTDVVETLHASDTLVPVDDGTQTTTKKDTKKESKSIGETITTIFTTNEQETSNYSSQSSIGKYFYEQLNETQKILYNGLQESREKMISGNYTIEFGNTFNDILSKEGGSKTLGDDYQTAIEAFTHDNPDLFYIDISKLYLNMETRKKAFSTTYNVYIAPEEGTKYFAKGFKSETDVKIAMQKIQYECDKIKSKLTGNTYKDIKIIHDYLVDNLDYDETYKSIGTYSIYGALVDKNCVCEGYTRAFKYLCDMAGIKCILMQGNATNSDGKTENHAWNAVYLNSSWYLIDTTWDDPIVIGNGRLLNSVHYKYFLKGTNTFNKDHVLDTQFTKGGKVFSYPNISESDY